MTCISPPEPEVRQLMAFLDGEADPAVEIHLQKCDHCRGRLESLAREQKRLTMRLYRASCPPPDELGEFHLRMLPSDRMLVISQHIRECPHCAREIGQLNEFLSDLAPGQKSSLVQKSKQLIAQLVSSPAESSAAKEPALVLRGEKDSLTLYEAEGMVIALDIQPAVEGKVKILGQLAADDQEDWTEAEVTLQQTGNRKMTGSVDDLGAFRFDEALSGSAEITIVSTEGIEVHIPDINMTV